MNYSLPFFLTALIAQPVLGAIVLTVDITDSAAVVFTATDNVSSVDGGLNSFAGISLVDFFSGNTEANNGSSVVSGSVDIGKTGGGRIGLDQYYIATDGNGYSINDIAFYSNTNVFTSVDTLTAALAGVATVDLSGFVLPTVGATGNVVLGSRTGTGVVFGTYQVVPEPATFAFLAGLGAVGCVLVRRRRQR